MAITNCPMCHTEIPTDQPVKTCVNCGADLSRWMPKPPPIPVIAASAPAETAVTTAGSNLGLGILGALIGAVLGAGIMFGFYEWAGFRFPLLGVGIGALTGLGAKLLFKGTDHTLGIISGGIAMVAVVGTLFLMYGEFPVISIISVIVSVSVAYRIAAR
jgi:hypothetical protein